MIGRIEETLRGMLSDPSVAVRLAASAALDRLRAKKSVSSYLQILKTGTLEERVRIVFAAEEIGGPEGQTLLLAALEDKEQEVRGGAVRALKSTLTGDVLRILVARLPGEEGVVLGNLLEALGKSRQKDLAPTIESYLGHPDAEVRGKAIQAYARVAEYDGWEKILAHATEQDETVRAAAARAFGEWSSS
ncbi:MAG: HEAT repeat domain-containing protein [Candidatus Deferrimicrobiaceae bacterium]